MMRVASEGVIMEATGSRSNCDPDGGGRRMGCRVEDGGSEIAQAIPARIFSTATRLRYLAAVCFEHNSSARRSRQRFVSVRIRTLGDT